MDTILELAFFCGLVFLIGSLLELAFFYGLLFLVGSLLEANGGDEFEGYDG